MLNLREANIGDLNITYEWINDSTVRANSYSNAPIGFERHAEWFKKKIADNLSKYYLFINDEKAPVGQVRIDKQEGNNYLLGILVDARFRGKGYAEKMLRMAAADFFEFCSEAIIIAQVFKSNIPSYHTFLKAGFSLVSENVINNIPSYIFHLKKTN